MHEVPSSPCASYTNNTPSTVTVHLAALFRFAGFGFLIGLALLVASTWQLSS
jgi:hypothetical protein